MLDIRLQDKDQANATYALAKTIIVLKCYNLAHSRSDSLVVYLRMCSLSISLSCSFVRGIYTSSVCYTQRKNQIIPEALEAL